MDGPYHTKVDQERYNRVVHYYTDLFLTQHPRFTRKLPESTKRRLQLAMDRGMSKGFAVFLLHRPKGMLLDRRAGPKLLLALDDLRPGKDN